MEAPHNLEFEALPGFDGVVGFRRPVGSEAALWHPWCSYSQTWREVAKWELDTTRDDVGVWLSNCVSFNKLWRTSVIDLLVSNRSGVRTRSFGNCRQNIGPEIKAFDPHALSSGLRLPDGKPGFCTRHRAMLAVENNACRDWISDNLCQALQCGAIPIIKSVWSAEVGGLLPDYQALYGDELEKLVINASRPGWLRELRQLMTNDTFYKLRHREWVAVAQRRLAQTPRADPGNYHCQWFDAMRAVGDARAKVAAGGARRDTFWQPCACPRGRRNDFDHGDEEHSDAHIRNHLRHRWMPTCATPPE